MAEVLGLELDDVSFDRKTVTFRPNGWRRLKTQGSWRVVPLWPQLEMVLRAWVFGPRLLQGRRLLFPSFASGSEAMLVETRKLLDRRVYSHLGMIRHRSEVMEYRVEQHFERLGDQLRRLSSDTMIDTNREVRAAKESPAITQGDAGEEVPEWARRDSNARPLAPEASALSN